MITDRNMYNIKGKIFWFTLYKFLRKAGILLEALSIMPASKHDDDQCYPVGGHADPLFFRSVTPLVFYQYPFYFYRWKKENDANLTRANVRDTVFCAGRCQ